MPPRSRLHFSLTFQTLLACGAGLFAGHLLASNGQSFAGTFVLQILHLTARTVLATGKYLAAPLIFAGIVTGTDGLEPMRGVGRLALKTAAWIIASSGMAALTGLLVGLASRPANRGALFPVEIRGNLLWSDTTGGEMWIALVLVALAFGVYRNQIDESRNRMLFRFSMVIDETLTLLLDWAARLIPWAVFCVAATAGAAALSDFAAAGQMPGLLAAMAAAWAIYALLLLPLALLTLARVNPWHYVLGAGPAVLAALAGAAPAEVFPLTLARVRTQGGISNRVGSLVLSGCTALLRDGQALGWAMAAAWLIPSQIHAAQFTEILLEAGLLGCAGAAISKAAAPALLLSVAAGSAARLDAGSTLAVGALISLFGNAISVFSQTCAAAVIARSEGETNLLPKRATETPFAGVLLEPPNL